LTKEAAKEGRLAGTLVAKRAKRVIYRSPRRKPWESMREGIQPAKRAQERS
jgi:hypothetical protein